MQCFIGVDGGATKTRVVIGDVDGHPLADAESGPSNIQVVGLTQATANLSAALRAALAASENSNVHCVRVVAGIAGLDSEDDCPAVYSLLADGLAAAGLASNWVAVNDALVAWAGALGGQAGGIVISGSGAAALAVNGRGEMALTDGLGHWLGDEGSGFEIGRNGLRAALRALEGRGPPTALTAPLQRLAGVNIDSWAADLTKDGALAHRTLTAFARDVVDIGCTGDTVALAILADAGISLAETGASVLRLVDLCKAPTVATVGGLFAHAQPLRGAFCRHMEKLLPGCQVIWPRYQPAEGALLLARRPSLLPKDVLSVQNNI